MFDAEMRESMETEYMVALVTVASPEAGVALGKTLVEERLAACVQVISGGTAVYRWQGMLSTDPMAQLIIKTRRALWPALQARILALHADEVPEILALPVTDGLPAYLAWLAEMTGVRPAETPPRISQVEDSKLPLPAWMDYAEVYPGKNHTVRGAIKVLRAVPSPQLGLARHVLAYLPPSYDRSHRRYPVLYMHDGQNLFDKATSFAGEWQVDEIMQELSTEGIEVIVVGIPNGGERRLREYTPFPDAHIPDTQGEAYMRYVVETVKPLIDRSFRTLPARESTGVMGSSLGGLISLYAFFRFPDVFGLAGAVSPALRAGDKAIFRYVEAAAKTPGRLYMDVGTREEVGTDKKSSERLKSAQRYLKLVRKMHALLLERGYVQGRDLLYVEEKGGVHHESAWARRLPAALRYLFGTV